MLLAGRIDSNSRVEAAGELTWARVRRLIALCRFLQTHSAAGEKGTR